MNERPKKERRRARSAATLALSWETIIACVDFYQTCCSRECRGLNERRFQNFAKSRHHFRRWLDGDLVLLQKRMPHGLARCIGRELIRQADWQCNWNGHAAPNEGRGDRPRQRVGIQRLTVEQHPKINSKSR